MVESGSHTQDIKIASCGGVVSVELRCALGDDKLTIKFDNGLWKSVS